MHIKIQKPKALQIPSRSSPTPTDTFSSKLLKERLENLLESHITSSSQNPIEIASLFSQIFDFVDETNGFRSPNSNQIKFDNDKYKNAINKIVKIQRRFRERKQRRILLTISKLSKFSIEIKSKDLYSAFMIFMHQEEVYSKCLQTVIKSCKGGLEMNLYSEPQQLLFCHLEELAERTKGLLAGFNSILEARKKKNGAATLNIIPKLFSLLRNFIPSLFLYIPYIVQYELLNNAHLLDNGKGLVGFSGGVLPLKTYLMMPLLRFRGYQIFVNELVNISNEKAKVVDAECATELKMELNHLLSNPTFSQQISFFSKLYLLSTTDEPKEGVHYDISKLVKSATVSRLFDILCDPIQKDLTFQDVFISTFHNYVTHQDFLRILVERFYCGTLETKAQARERKNRILHVIKKWVNERLSTQVHNFELVYDKLTLFLSRAFSSEACNIELIMLLEEIKTTVLLKSPPELMISSKSGRESPSLEKVKIHSKPTNSNSADFSRNIQTTTRSLSIAYSDMKSPSVDTNIEPIKRHIRSFDTSTRTNSSRDPFNSRSRTPSSITLVYNITPARLAQQITLKEMELFGNIVLPDEFSNQGWVTRKDKPNSEATSINLVAYIENFNLMSLWVMKEILKDGDINDRVFKIEYFIKLAEELLALNNINGVMEICSSLQQGSIRRLIDTWKKLTPSSLESLKFLECLTSSSGNSRYIRKLQNTNQLPCIPYLGIILGDITLIEEGNPSKLEYNSGVSKTCILVTGESSPLDSTNRNPSFSDSSSTLASVGSSTESVDLQFLDSDQEKLELINYEKFRMLSSIFLQVEKLQKSRIYQNISKDEEISRFLDEICRYPISQDEIWMMTYAILPKGSKIEMERESLQLSSLKNGILSSDSVKANGKGSLRSSSNLCQSSSIQNVKTLWDYPARIKRNDPTLTEVEIVDAKDFTSSKVLSQLKDYFQTNTHLTKFTLCCKTIDTKAFQHLVSAILSSRSLQTLNLQNVKRRNLQYILKNLKSNLSLVNITTSFSVQKTLREDDQRVLESIRQIVEANSTLRQGMLKDNSKNLDLSKREFTKVPDELNKLQGPIEKLNLSENLLRSHRSLSNISSLISLTFLDLSYNRLSDLNPSITKLKNLQSLLLKSNTLGPELPVYLCLFPHLKVLDVSSNGIQQIPRFLGTIESLNSLVISKGNYVSKKGSTRESHPSKGQLASGSLPSPIQATSGSLRRTLTAPSVDLFVEEDIAILRSLKEITSTQEAPVFRASLLFLGHKDVGKSFLKNSLKRDTVCLNSLTNSQRIEQEKNEPSDKIETTRWALLPRSGAQELAFTCSEIPCDADLKSILKFQNESVIYIIVYDLSSPESGLVQIRYYLENIKNDSPIIMIGNHIDKCGNSDKVRQSILKSHSIAIEPIKAQNPRIIKWMFFPSLLSYLASIANKVDPTRKLSTIPSNGQLASNNNNNASNSSIPNVPPSPTPDPFNKLLEALRKMIIRTAMELPTVMNEVYPTNFVALEHKIWALKSFHEKIPLTDLEYIAFTECKIQRDLSEVIWFLQARGIAFGYHPQKIQLHNHQIEGQMNQSKAAIARFSGFIQRPLLKGTLFLDLNCLVKEVELD